MKLTIQDGWLTAAPSDVAQAICDAYAAERGYRCVWSMAGTNEGGTSISVPVADAEHTCPHCGRYVEDGIDARCARCGGCDVCCRDARGGEP